MKVWDTSGGQDVLTFEANTSSLAQVVFSPDGKRLASASRDRTIKLWDTTTGQETLTLKGPSQAEDWGEDGARNVAFGPDGQRLAASWYSTVKVWDARPRSQESTPEAKTR